jgi:2-oxoglutarate ferredoxin oxidoreductase subunit beta
MSTTTTPPGPKVNRIGLGINDYKGGDSTLCAGCGHDAITSQIIRAFWEYGVEPHRVAKMSGIGCSSKTPAYFLNQAHGINAVHGRMPSIATGTMLANRNLVAIGVSGDGDSASIGLGQFCHLLRRNIPMIYIVENNGVYGLTKGQFSATADLGSRSKTGDLNELPAIDICALALEMGCSFIARSFAGDPKQLLALLKAGISHKGTVLLDVISPCVTFNNHEGSTKSYRFAKTHEELLHDISYVPFFEQTTVDYEDGEAIEVQMHDGSQLRLKKTARNYDPTNKQEAFRLLAETDINTELLTGLIYVNETQPDFVSQMNLSETPLAHLTEKDTRPGREALDEVMRSLM